MPPNKPRGVPRVNDRRVLNGIFWGGHDELATRSVGMIARSLRLVCFADLTRHAAETPCFDQSPIVYEACTKAPTCSLMALKFCVSDGMESPRASKSRTIVPLVVHRPQ